ncbi:MAG: hypothetical protein A3C08_00940 [Candidatus Taylorbacteria bacterium RIFCSPHIGHO2_02_FULL_47_18]|uniref:Methyltransferase FkbM domain-containing protein n=1 Tax=Candidatus Taylorbacteria bacterium RIFCSPLOWO2_01_FULL_48_100 TaxID=1802322 RepID=A0A1G2NGK1_9BACT|nr:MAG: hypothetical protein A2670_03015 [Candidatus Taylorbacteria bacterium RIFCSPHIGHO2_01_FULL_48_38]OHA27535.1 MAG: hypothetical protein A3C08_00940 [Candidatus Taylorbacteria bacterium RIFCSPHIGHO2_02_FULL_47_18]OHA34599.1 MAG: hypothetical protein A2938_03560 [Candidatus Taylorbacteria bacterium RIFCSPLOWO2_01_FULL_48_100]
MKMKKIKKIQVALWKIYGGIKNILSAFVGRLWSVLPLYTQSYITTHTPPIGNLHYKNRVIKMNVSSTIAYKYLRAYKKEPATIRWLEKNISANSVFYDIGANIGAYSFIALMLSEIAIPIYSFEPGQCTFAVLCENIFLNKMKTIFPIPFPLSDATRLTYFSYGTLRAGSAVHPGVNMNPTLNCCFSHLVQAYSLDDLVRLANLPYPTIMKIDVDGHELQVIRGAHDVIKSPYLKTIQVEIDEKDEGCIQIVDLIENAGLKMIEKSQKGTSRTYDYRFVRV